MKTPFSTTDLEKEKNRCENILKNHKGFCGTAIAEEIEFLRMYPFIIKERQRLKAEVEKIIDEYFVNATLPNSRELKQKLGLK